MLVYVRPEPLLQANLPDGRSVLHFVEDGPEGRGLMLVNGVGEWTFVAVPFEDCAGCGHVNPEPAAVGIICTPERRTLGYELCADCNRAAGDEERQQDLMRRVQVRLSGRLLRRAKP